jgi:hypothetical protein
MRSPLPKIPILGLDSRLTRFALDRLFRPKAIDSVSLAEIVLVGALAGLVQGLSGFAFGLVATSLWAWIMAPQLVVPMVALGSLFGQMASMPSVRRHVQWSRLLPFLVGGAIGVPLGTLLLHGMSGPTFRTSVGLVLIVYCSTMLWVSNLPRVAGGGRGADGAVGVLSGAMNGASALAGPPIILWCSLRGWSKNDQRATYQPFFIWVQALALALFTWQGLINQEVLQIFLWVGPVIVLSSWFGSRLARRFSDMRFQRLVFLMILASGTMLVMPVAARAIHRLFASFSG